MDEVVVAVIGSRTWVWRFPGTAVELRGEWADGNAPIHLDTVGGRRDVLGPVEPCDVLPAHVDATIRLEGDRATLEIEGTFLVAGEVDAVEPVWTPPPPDPLIDAKELAIRCWRASLRSGGSAPLHRDVEALGHLDSDVRTRLLALLTSLRALDTQGWGAQMDEIDDILHAVRGDDDAYRYLDPVIAVLRGVLEPGARPPANPPADGPFPTLPKTSTPSTEDARHALRVFHIAGLLQHYGLTPTTDETNGAHWDRLFEGAAWRSGPHRLVTFAEDPTGTAYCVWLRQGEPSAPVVLLGSEGELAVLAGSVVDLLRAFALGARWDGHAMTVPGEVGPATQRAQEMDRAQIAAALAAAWGTDARPLEHLTGGARTADEFREWCTTVRGR